MNFDYFILLNLQIRKKIYFLDIFYANLYKIFFRLICKYSGEIISETNRPMMLPNGHVYGENTIRNFLDSEKKFTCPKTHEKFSIEEIKRVFVL